MLIKLPPMMPTAKFLRLIEAAQEAGIPFSYPEEKDMPRGGEQMLVDAPLIKRVQEHSERDLRTFGIRLHFDDDEEAILFKLKYT